MCRCGSSRESLAKLSSSAYLDDDVFQLCRTTADGDYARAECQADTDGQLMDGEIFQVFRFRCDWSERRVLPLIALLASPLVYDVVQVVYTQLVRGQNTPTREVRGEGCARSVCAVALCTE
jgi:hypothetical protein